MARPQKCRKVCQLPKVSEFIPAGETDFNQWIILTVDEYETVRLIDRQGFSQEECSVYMNVARTTVQQIYTNAREKISRSLVDGLPLRISGGHYCLCSRNGRDCEYCGCRKHRRCEQKEGC